MLIIYYNNTIYIVLYIIYYNYNIYVITYILKYDITYTNSKTLILSH